MAESPEYEEKARRIEANVARVIVNLEAWARHLAARYGVPIQLCGSVLCSPTPRDCDVRIVLPDHEFELRYGQTPDEYVKNGPSQVWIDELAKFNRGMVRHVRMPMDVQVWPKSKWDENSWPRPIILAAPSPRWFVHNAYHPKSQAMLDMEAEEDARVAQRSA